MEQGCLDLAQNNIARFHEKAVSHVESQENLAAEAGVLRNEIVMYVDTVRADSCSNVGLEIALHRERLAILDTRTRPAVGAVVLEITRLIHVDGEGAIVWTLPEVVAGASGENPLAMAEELVPLYDADLDS